MKNLIDEIVHIYVLRHVETAAFFTDNFILYLVVDFTSQDSWLFIPSILNGNDWLHILNSIPLLPIEVIPVASVTAL